MVEELEKFNVFFTKALPAPTLRLPCLSCLTQTVIRVRRLFLGNSSMARALKEH